MQEVSKNSSARYKINRDEYDKNYERIFNSNKPDLINGEEEQYDEETSEAELLNN